MNPLFIAVSALLLILILPLSGCSSSGVELNTSEEAHAYLEKTFPGKHIGISERYRDNFWGDHRTWSFTMEEYPNNTFTVISRKSTDDLIPFIYTGTVWRNNVYTVIQQEFLSEFEKSIGEVYGEVAEKAWKGLRNTVFYRAGFNQFYEDGSYPNTAAEPVHIEISNYADLPAIQNLMDGMLDTLHEQDLEISDFGFKLSMEVDYTMLQGAYFYMFGLSGNSTASTFLGGDFKYATMHSEYDPGYNSTTDTIEKLRDNLVGYSILTAQNSNSVTDEAKQAWLQKRIQRQIEAKAGTYGPLGFSGNNWYDAYVGYESTHYLWGRMWTEDRDEASKGFYLTLAEAMLFYQQCGLTVSGDQEAYSVVGVDGNTYEFNANWQRTSKGGYDYKKNGETMLYSYNMDFSHPFTVHQSLLKEISGVDITEYLISTAVEE